jgi:pimeloyl-ACP methyl ester carboxylesterase
MAQTTGTIDFRGTKICYTKAGSGPPVVLVHGWSFNYQGWQPQIDLLARTHTVIAYDWMGMGCSGGGERWYKFQLHLDLLDHVIKELCGGEKPIVIGHSVGSTVTLAYAVQSSNRIVAAACADGALPVFRTTLFAAFFNLWMVVFRNLKTIEWLITRLFFSRAWRKSDPAGLNKWRQEWETNNARRLWIAQWIWTLRPNPRSQLGRISVPMLFINGSVDVATPLWAMKKLHKLVPGSELAVMATGHMVYVEQPEIFNTIIEPFVRRWTKP